MSFDGKKFDIEHAHIRKGNARSGAKIKKVVFLVAHDTGNPGSTAYGNRNYFHNYQPSASAQTFIDHERILVIVPLDEKAWHVRYNVEKDNELYGDDANDCAIGTELCYGGKIDFKEAYKKYVWFHAYLCHEHGLDPEKDIVPHATLDPSRRTDPHNALNKHGITFEQFIQDVKKELGGEPAPADENEVKTEVKQIQVRDTKEIREEGLHTYGSANWEDKTGPVVKPNTIFTVKRKLQVDGYPMYQLISGWYITAAEEFVKVHKTAKDTEPKPEPDVGQAIVPYPGKLIKKGSRGIDVQRIQRAVKITADGIYGPKTERAVKRYQTRHGLTADGIVGPKTWNKMF
jgi:N-acetylmuramoyl-L-alanine amidase